MMGSLSMDDSESFTGNVWHYPVPIPAFVFVIVLQYYTKSFRWLLDTTHITAWCDVCDLP